MPRSNFRGQGEDTAGWSWLDSMQTIACLRLSPQQSTRRRSLMLSSLGADLLRNANDNGMARRLTNYFLPGFFLALGRSSRAVEASIPRMVE